MVPFFTRLIRACIYSRKGLVAAFRSEAAFRQEVLLLMISLPLAYFITAIWWERIALIGVIMIVMFVELLNTAIEKLADLVNPEIHPVIGQIKDMCSAAVAISLLLAAMVWFLTIALHFF